MRIVADSRDSSSVSRSLTIKFVFPCSGMSVLMVGMQISVGIIASMP